MSVSLSVYPPVFCRNGIINLFHCQVASPPLFFCIKQYRNIPTGTPPLQEGYEKIAIFDQYDEEKEREQNLIVRSGKPEAEITNNKIRRSRYRTAEANTNRQTQSIAQPLCDSRATCSSFK